MRDMRKYIARALWSVANRLGQRPRLDEFPPGYAAEELETYRAVAPYTMTDKYRVLTLIHAVRYIERCHIEGDIVECGVWKGGSMMTVARTLQLLGTTARTLYLFDTYEGMPRPTKHDVGPDDFDAGAEYERQMSSGPDGGWHRVSLDEVKRNLMHTGYPEHHLRFVKGKVEDTLPEAAPAQIALLRLDTDWYESTRWELEHLYPRVSRGGIIIIDDYLYWRGSRQAVDEYTARHGVTLFLGPVDGGAVVGVKQH